jgi:prepilin-type N-terminal cleavage/methylation domain-containing protein
MGNRPPRAFSLVELVIVMAIIGIMAAIAIPRYAGAIQNYRADLAARRIVTDLAMTRSRANIMSASQRIVFDVAANQYQVADMPDPDSPLSTYTVRLSAAPYQARLVSVDFGGTPDVSFDGFGVPAKGGTVIIQAGDIQRKVVLNPGTGKAVVQ